MSLDLMQLVCDVKYITWGYVVMGYGKCCRCDTGNENF